MRLEGTRLPAADRGVPAAVCSSRPPSEALRALLAIIILALLMATAIPILGRLRGDEGAETLVADARLLYDGLMRYNAENGAFPADDGAPDRTLDPLTLEPLAGRGYFLRAPAFLSALEGQRVVAYIAPDLAGPDQQFLLVVRSRRDPSSTVVVAHTDLAGALGPEWLDGVYLLVRGSLVRPEKT